MALTPEQSAAIEKIMAEYRKELHGILDKHRQAVAEAVARIDKEQAERLHQIISGL